MICVSIAEPDVEKCVGALAGLELAEIRLDKIAINETKIKQIFSQPLKLIATCRPETGDEKKRKQILFSAIEAGAAFVDIEVEASDEYKKAIVAKAKPKGCQVIVSFHDYKKTPSKAELDQIVEWCFQSGADMAKIACEVHSERDSARLLGLLDQDKKIIVVGMGARGRITRIIAPLLGSPFTFASLEKGKETADGQLTKTELEQAMQQLGVLK